jgi:hypothetical protein
MSGYFSLQIKIMLVIERFIQNHTTSAIAHLQKLQFFSLSIFTRLLFIEIDFPVCHQYTINHTNH